EIMNHVNPVSPVTDWLVRTRNFGDRDSAFPPFFQLELKACGEFVDRFHDTLFARKAEAFNNQNAVDVLLIQSVVDVACHFVVEFPGRCERYSLLRAALAAGSERLPVRHGLEAASSPVDLATPTSRVRADKQPLR